MSLSVGDTESEGLVGLENSLDPAEDPGAYKAISTIERLSRKYLVCMHFICVLVEFYL